MCPACLTSASRTLFHTWSHLSAFTMAPRRQSASIAAQRSTAQPSASWCGLAMPWNGCDPTCASDCQCGSKHPKLCRIMRNKHHTSWWMLMNPYPFPLKFLQFQVSWRKWLIFLVSQFLSKSPTMPWRCHTTIAWRMLIHQPLELKTCGMICCFCRAVFTKHAMKIPSGDEISLWKMLRLWITYDDLLIKQFHIFRSHVKKPEGT